MSRTLTDPAESPIPPRSPVLRLLAAYAGPDAPPRIYARPNELPLFREVLVGREASPGLALPEDTLASRRHARFTLDRQGAVVLQDLESRNGTWVNGEKVARRALQDGDVVQIGGSFLLLRWLDAASAALDAEVPELLGYSPAVRALRHGLHEAAQTPQRVLLLGETGTGKEVAARALHRLYGQRQDRFVAVNCSALPEGLAESLLFGHERGAYSGAQTATGFFRAADGGTLFLDEVGDLPLALQPKLLRAIEEQKVNPVGTTQLVPVQLRLIAATNRELRQPCAVETFRLDLYMRLAQRKLQIAPLRARQEDILLLAQHFMKGRAEPLTPAVMRRLLAHPFPGNVRELCNAAVQLAHTGRLELDCPSVDPAPRAPRPAAKEQTLRQVPADLPEDDGPDACKRAPRRGEGQGRDDPARPPVTRETLEQVLRETRGNVAEAARRLERSERQINRLAEKHGLCVHDFRKLR